MAVRRWVGGAVAKFDVWTITVASVWASGDTVTISIGNKDLIITLGASASTVVADIAAEIADAINAADNTAPGTGFTWSHGGQQFREFTEITATVLGAVVTVTAVTAGVPIGLVVTENTAGAGTATEANTVAATGPYHLDNADNYLGGVLPVDNDDLWFDTGDVSALYGLTYFRANNIDLNVYITNDWTGSLGLPAIRTITAGTYAEYRQRYFQVRGGSKVLQVLPGLNGTGSSAGNLYLDFQSQSTCTVSILARRGAGGTVPTVFIAGSTTGSAMNAMVITAGTVAIEPDDAPTTAGDEFWPSDLTIGTPGSAATDCIVTIGSKARLAEGVSLTVNGGTVTSYSPTTDGAEVIPTVINGGSVELAAAGDENIIEVAAGATLYLSGSGSCLKIFNRGTIDFRRGVGLKVCNDLKLYADSSYYCPFQINVAHFVGCSIGQLAAFQGPANISVDLSTAATPT